MELKKSPEHDLSKKTGMFLNLGLTLSLLIVILAFEWPNRGSEEIMDFGELDADFEDIMEIPPTDQPPPPPPKVQIPEIIEVPDEKELEEEIEVELDVEMTEETVVEDIVFEQAPEEEEVDEIFTIVEDQPEFPGGMQAFYSFVSKRMKYPSQAKRMGIEGRVYLEFVVGKDGAVTNVRSVKGIGAGCDEEAVRVMKTVPKFKPGKQRGRAVKVKMVMPIYFKLAN